MPDLELLRRAVFPSAAELVPIAGAAPDVAWVRVLKPRVPAFDALDQRDVALIPASALATLIAGGVEPSTVVDALAEAGASAALLVGSGPDPGEAELIRRAGEASIPLWRLADDDVTTIERAIIAVLINERAAIERRAAELESELGALALAGADLTAEAAVVAAALGRAVAIEGPRGQVVAVHAPSDPTAAGAAAAYLANRRHVLLRTSLPGQGGALPGALVLLGEPPATEFERVAVDRISALMALELSRDLAGRREAGPTRRSDAMPADGPPWVALMTRQLVAGRASELEARERLRERIARLAPARRLRLRGDARSLELRVVVAAAGADPLGLAMAARVAELAGRTVAVSRPFHRPDDRPLAEQEARATLEAAEALPSAASPGLIVRADRLAALRLLGSLHNLPDGVQNARLLLAPLLVGRPSVVAERLATLRAVLEQPGLSQASRSLGIHRNTLAYRIGRIEAAGGWRLDEPDVRFVLALAVRVVQNAQEVAGT
ncbi:MAG: helix-turn-helix domain-containing protein [Candidatus Limnocylindrales bacterium]